MDLFEQIKTIWDRLPGQQRVFMVFIIITLIAVIVIGGTWAGRVEYGVLYSNLSSEDMGDIVQELESRGVKHKLTNNGTTVSVPKTSIHETRLSLASAGLPSAGGQGYELLDSNKMGWTDFVQKIQSRRALEGEIGRTISSLQEVASARVHLVIPESALFAKDEKPVTASVVVNLKSGRQLQDSHVQGIIHLVAAGVEGLQPTNITVLDTSGRLLSRPSDDGLLSTSSDQLQLTATVENSLIRKVQTALERVLGPNKAVVRISTQLDFQQSETTSETYDSENPAVRSEMRSESSGGDDGTNEESTTNYEVSKTIQRVVHTPGTIERLSVSVFIDGTYSTDEEGVKEYVPRSDLEMLQLTNLVKASLGFDPARGDELSIENIAFDNTEMDNTLVQLQKDQQMQMIEKMGGLAVSVILAAGALFILWRLIRKMTVVQVAPGAGGRASGADGSAGLIDDLDDTDVKTTDIKQLRLQKKLEEISKSEPDDIARIITAWMREA